MTVGSHRAGKVDPMHKAPAKKSIQRISVVRQNDLGHLGDRFTHGTGTSQSFLVCVVAHKLWLLTRPIRFRNVLSNRSIRRTIRQEQDYVAVARDRSGDSNLPA